MLTVLNNQPAEHLEHRDDGSLDVHSVWYTIQGEGPFSGVPAVFVRLAGCNLRCLGCDTDYTSTRERMTPTELVSKVVWVCPQVPTVLTAEGMVYSHHEPLVVLTGGEPFRQNVGPFVEALLGTTRFRIQVETNGTCPTPVVFQGWGNRTSVVCSPKNIATHKNLTPYVDAWKYVVEDEVDPDDGLPVSVLGRPVRPARPPSEVDRNKIFLQPVERPNPEDNARSLKLTVETCLKFGYRLSLQTHKIVGLP